MNLYCFRIVMKITVLYLFSGTAEAFSQGVLITAGQDYAIDIPFLNYSGPGSIPGFSPGIKIVFTNDLFDAGESFSVEFFKTSYPNTPLSSFTAFALDSSPRSLFEVIQVNEPLPLSSLPAFVKVSTINGSIEL